MLIFLVSNSLSVSREDILNLSMPLPGLNIDIKKR